MTLLFSINDVYNENIPHKTIEIYMNFVLAKIYAVSLMFRTEVQLMNPISIQKKEN